MANVTETPSYDAGIYQIETTDPVLGGPNGIANAQAKGLANRTAFLKQQIDQLNSGQLTPAWIASQDYVQEQLQKLDAKQSVRAATTANITLSGVQTIDGVVLTVGDRVLVKDQTTAAQNGIYLVAAQSWSRSKDSDDGTKLNSGARIAIEEGTINAGSIWYLATSGNISVGSTALLFSNEHPDASETGKGISRFATALEANPASEDVASQSLIASIARVFTVIRSAAANASETLRGSLRIATQSEVNAGTLDSVTVTPQKLLFGFQCLLATNGYLKTPEWMGGYIIQWGKFVGNGAGKVITGNFTIPYPNTPLISVGFMSDSVQKDTGVSLSVNLEHTSSSAWAAGLAVASSGYRFGYISMGK